MMDAVFYGFVVLVFAAVILLVEGAYLWWSNTHGSGARRIERRLRVMASGADADGGRISILKQRCYSKNPAMDAFLHQLRLANAIDRLLLQTGLKWSVMHFFVAMAGSAFLVLLLVHSWNLPVMAKLAMALAGAGLPYVLVRRARTARLLKIEGQLPEAADFLSRAMRAGHSFTNVLQMVGGEMPEPISSEFRMVHEEMNYGVPMNEALYNLAERVPLTDLRYLVIAVLIQRESGGNLAEILGSIALIIRERLKLVAKVRVLSAEGRMSAWILGSLPFAMAGVMLVINPAYISMMWTHPTGVKMLWIGGGLMLVGAVVIRRLVQIRI
jgi:tight adherence protein B